MATRQNNDPQAEIERYRKALDENPGSRLFAALADAMRRSGDVEGAISVAENGLKRHPRYLGGMVVLGQAYADNQQFDRGKELFLQVVRMNPENIVAQRALAEIYEKLGENFNAMRTYAILNILDPSDKKVRQRLQELEETRAGATRPASAPMPFSTPPPSVRAPEPASEAEPREESAEPPAPEPPPTPEAKEIVEPTPQAAESLVPPPAEAPAEDPVVPPPDPEPVSSPQPEVEKRMAGLDQFFSGDQVPDQASTPPLPSAPTENPADDAAPSDEGSDTAVIPVDLVPPPPPVPQPSLSIDEKLDLFFGGVDLNRLGAAQRAQEFVVRAAQEALDDPAVAAPAFSAPPSSDGQDSITINHSKLGAIFWEQGFRDQALSVMAGEIKSRPGDELLRVEFARAARFLDQDPDAMLEKLSPGLSTRVSTPEPQPEPASETRPMAETVSPAAAPAPDESSSTDPRINILRSYLKRVRQGQGEKK